MHLACQRFPNGILFQPGQKRLVGLFCFSNHEVNDPDSRNIFFSNVVIFLALFIRISVLMLFPLFKATDYVGVGASQE